MGKELQSLCVPAGAISIFVGPRLLTTDNPDRERDDDPLGDLKMRPMGPPHGEPLP